MRALVAGATGFVGRRLVDALLDDGHRVRCLVRDRARAEGLLRDGAEIHEGDALRPASLESAGAEVDVAYYLIHSMAGGGDFGEREQRAARNFAGMARASGIGRVIYIGGLGDHPPSDHLRSRHETARILEREGPPLTYLRAAMIVGPESESYRTLKYLVQRLPVMIAPAWLQTPTQPVAIADVIEYLRLAPSVPESVGREIQIGGPDVLPYGEMLDVMARVLGKRPRPKLKVPVLTPRLSSLWLGLFTPVDTTVARPLVEGLTTRTVVTDESGARLFDVEPTPFERALRDAVDEEEACD